jgi:hypothetical protein
MIVMGSKELLQILESFLGTSQLNVLGQYELLSGTTIVATVPSIKVNYPMAQEKVVRRMKKDTGVECVISHEPSTYHKYHGFGNVNITNYWEIILDMHHPTNSLNNVVTHLLRLPTLHFPERPILRPAYTLEGNKGIAPARAVLYACQKQFATGYW